MLQFNNTETKATLFTLTAAIVFAVACFHDTDAEVYLFPRILAGLMLALGLIQLLHTAREKTEPPQKPDTGAIAWPALLPGLAVTIVFVLSLETLGFYTGSFLAFLCIVLIYGKREWSDYRAFVYKALIGGLFMLVLYGLFWKLLYVRTPQGWLL